MKKTLTVLLCQAPLFFSLAIGAYASDASEKSFFSKLGDNIWYILIVIAFGAGLILISKWSSKIRSSDEKNRKEYEDWKKEHPEEANEFENRQFLGIREDPEEVQIQDAADEGQTGTEDAANADAEEPQTPSEPTNDQ